VASVAFPRSPKATSRIGFGCAYLTGGFEERSNRRLVDIAYEEGYRHFDVAPYYGVGTAEDVLGASLKGRRDTVTIASKVGIPRPRLSIQMQLLRMAALPMRKLTPALTRKFGTKIVSSAPANRDYSPAVLEASIRDSLKRLKTDYLDVLLLHDANLADLTDEVLSFLEKRRSEGNCRSIGIASAPSELIAVAAAHKSSFDVFQYPWSIFDAELPKLSDNAFHITHRAIMRAFEALAGFPAKGALRLRTLSDAIGYDLNDRIVLSKVLLGASISRNTNGIALVGTRRIDRVRHNATLIYDDSFVEAGRKLLATIKLGMVTLGA